MENINQEFTDAIEKGDLDKVKVYFDKGVIAINQQDKSGYTLLAKAVIWDHFDIAKYLYENGADIDQPDNYGFTPLMLACTRDCLKIAKFLCQKGANVNAFSKNVKYSALLITHDLEVTKFLHQAGADINHTCDKGVSAIQYSAWANDIETVEYLYKMGSNIYHNNNLSGSIFTFRTTPEMSRFLDTIKDKRVIPLRLMCINTVYAKRIPYDHLPSVLFAM